MHIFVFSARTMTEASQLKLQLMSWFLLSICAVVTAKSNSTCEVVCLRRTRPNFWNQLKCCPESLLKKQAVSPDNQIDVIPVPDDGSMLNNTYVDESTASMPDDDYHFWDNQIDVIPVPDDRSMLNNIDVDESTASMPDDDYHFWDNQIDILPVPEDGPMLNNTDVDESTESMPSVRKRRSPGRGNGTFAIEKGIPRLMLKNSTCVHPFVYTEPLHQEFIKFADENMFRVSHDCLHQFIGSEIHMKCQDFRNVSSLESVIPVVDINTTLIYANRFCAVCNNINIKEVDAFHLDFICSNELLGHWDLLSLKQTEENQIDLFQSGLCVYSLQPPDDKTLDTAGNTCLSAKYTDCNQTEDALVTDYDWKKYNIFTESLESDRYCALCGYRSVMLSNPNIRQPANTVQEACHSRRSFDPRVPLMSFPSSF